MMDNFSLYPLAGLALTDPLRDLLLLATTAVSLILLLAVLLRALRGSRAARELHELQVTLRARHEETRHVLEVLQHSQHEARTHFEQRQNQTAVQLQEQLNHSLLAISGQVEKRLDGGFEKTNATFANVMQRLLMIDEAQKRITELSSNVISLKSILSDKNARGAFGEVQLAGLVRNLMPEGTFYLQHTLSNGKRVDCLLLLPAPAGAVPIDAKFPLESYRVMIAADTGEGERRAAEKQFKLDVRTHIRDIASKYILPGETADGAILFLPAEAVFAEIQARHTDLVEEAQRARVWITSPTTLWAILNTARAVLKDAQTRKEVHAIQEHLRELNKDFERFRERMDALAKHINQASQDVQEVHSSAKKISSRFSSIEQVELPTADTVDTGNSLAGKPPAPRNIEPH